MSNPRSEEELEAELARAISAQERGRLHAELAVCAGRALAYRRMNRHEEESAKAFAEDSEPLRRAYETYRAAIDAFGNRRDADGVRLLLQAQPVIVAELGEDHPYAHQISNTLAGRLAGPDTLAQRLALRSWLLTRSVATYGAHHTKTAQCRAAHAYALAAVGRASEAMGAFEHAIDNLLQSPWPDQAGPLLLRLGQLSRAAGEPHRTAARERAILARAPNCAWTVREVFFRRAPEAARRFNAEALERCSLHFPELQMAPTSASSPPIDNETAHAAFALASHAYYTHTDTESPSLSADWVLTALSRRDEELRGPVPSDGARACACIGEEEGPLAKEEFAMQTQHFEALLSG